MVGKGTITMRETRILEFKETITNTFLKTVSAFSNYNGGTILFGVDDNGNVKGLPDVKQACLDIENKINDSISPQPNYTLEIQNNDQTIKLTVKSGLQKPYLYKSKAYKRNDTATIEVMKFSTHNWIIMPKWMKFNLCIVLLIWRKYVGWTILYLRANGEIIFQKFVATAKSFWFGTDVSKFSQNL